MKDIELLLPMLREFLDERGLNEVCVTLILAKVNNEVLNETYSNEVATIKNLYSNRVYLNKSVPSKDDTIILQSNIFNQ